MEYPTLSIVPIDKAHLLGLLPSESLLLCGEELTPKP